MISENAVKGIINARPYPIPIELRPVWRIALIVLSIHIVSGDKKYIGAKKLNILIWMVIRKSLWHEYERYLIEEKGPIPLVSVDTATYRAVEMSIAKELIKLGDGRVYLTDTGVELSKTLTENHIMGEEAEFLNNVGKKLTEVKVRLLTGELF